jgi:serine/threonine protein kinase
VTTSTAQKSTIVPEKSTIVPVIGKYHLIAELARGGMGDVYLAVSQGPGGFSKLHAVKELKPSLCDDETYVTMFLEEARLAARLIHPNIVQTNEVASEDGRHFMVMEFLDGRSLHRIGKRLGVGLTVNAHLRIIAEALLGLHYAHELRGFDGEALGMVHRDVSPMNVFVTFNGQAKVLDFGIAKTANSALETKRGVLKGRVAYMSPEQANGAKVDRRADIYSAGVMIWEAAAGRRLWSKMTEVEILTRLLRDGAPSLRAVQPHAPEELNRICARAMAYRREDRYASAADLLCDLELFLARDGDTVTMRDIGALVGQAFGDERRKMNWVIEETLARVPRGPRSGVMPAFRTPLGATASNANILAEGSAGAVPPLSSPSDSLGPHSTSHSLSAPATAASLGTALATGAASSARKRVAIPIFALGVLFLSGLLFGTAWHRGRAPAHAIAPIAAGVSAPVVSASPRGAPTQSHVTVSAFPTGVQIYVDDAAVANPYVADQVRDATPHRLRVEAPGYQPKTRMIAFGEDVDLQITLDPARQAPARRGAPRANPPPNPSTNEAPSCQPPYVVDLETGTKRWRMECL